MTSNNRKTWYAVWSYMLENNSPAKQNNERWLKNLLKVDVFT